MISKTGVQINMGGWKNNSEINKQVGGWGGGAVCLALKKNKALTCWS